MEAAALKNIMAFGEMTQGALGGAQSILSGDFSADRLDFNATMADIQAKDAIARGDEEANLLLQDIAGIIGKQRTSYAAQGVDVNAGSAGAVQGQTKALGELDAATIRANAKRRALGFTTEAGEFRSKASYSRAAGFFGAGSSLISGGLQAARALK